MKKKDEANYYHHSNIEEGMEQLILTTTRSSHLEVQIPQISKSMIKRIQCDRKELYNELLQVQE